MGSSFGKALIAFQRFATQNRLSLTKLQRLPKLLCRAQDGLKAHCKSVSGSHMLLHIAPRLWTHSWIAWRASLANASVGVAISSAGASTRPCSADLQTGEAECWRRGRRQG